MLLAVARLKDTRRRRLAVPLVDENILWFDVAVNNAVLVHELQRKQELLRQ